jgi:hypothetical protein
VKAFDENMASIEHNILACSSCFNDSGLKLDAIKAGFSQDSICPNCLQTNGNKLDEHRLSELASSFFVRGSVFRSFYGAANVLQFNEYHYGKEEVDVPSWLQDDLRLIEKLLKVGLFYYAPSLWKLGEIEPLIKLTEADQRSTVIYQILDKFPTRNLPAGTSFYRLRKNPKHPVEAASYDSAPDEFLGKGRLDSVTLPVLYGSQDLDICIHECRVTVEDNLYVGLMSTLQPLNVLDLTGEITEEGDAFESLRLTIHMLFRAPDHSYDIIRAIAVEAKARGLDGLIYPSYFSRLHVNGDTIENIGLFGRPVLENKIAMMSAHRIILNTVVYDYNFGPSDC